MAQPLELDGAMKCALRPFGRRVSDFLTPSTSTLRLMASQSSADPALPCRLGIFQCESTTMRPAFGWAARISRPRAYSSTAGSR
jgi:hypothetical protein